MRIRPVQTGTVQCRRRMVRGVGGPLRRAALVTGPWTEALPILAWVIEHDEGVLLVDTGEHEHVRDAPFAKFAVTEQDHLAVRLRGMGIDPAAVRTAVLTHLHGDHMNGFVDLPSAEAVVSVAEWASATSLAGRATQALTRQPLPQSFDPRVISFDGPRVGGFASSHPLTRAGDVVLVPAHGHTPGHLAVLVRLDDHDVLLCGDAVYDQQQLLDRAVDAVSPRAAVARDTMDTILRHCAQRPTVVLPSHDPDAVGRLSRTEFCPAA